MGLDKKEADAVALVYAELQKDLERSEPWDFGFRRVVGAMLDYFKGRWPEVCR